MIIFTISLKKIPSGVLSRILISEWGFVRMGFVQWGFVQWDFVLDPDLIRVKYKSYLLLFIYRQHLLNPKITSLKRNSAKPLFCTEILKEATSN